METTALQKITAKAKQLRKADKKMSWKDAIKKASAHYRASSGPAKKKAVRKKIAGQRKAKKQVQGAVRKVGKPAKIIHKKAVARVGSEWNAGDAQKNIILKKISERLASIDRSERGILLIRNALKNLYRGKGHAAHRKVLTKKILHTRALIRSERQSISQLKKLL